MRKGAGQGAVEAKFSGFAGARREIAPVAVTNPFSAVRLMKIDGTGFTVCGPRFCRFPLSPERAAGRGG
jgi:hypothetical protein